MKTFGQHLKEELRDELIPLAKACPLDNRNPEDCPLYLIRKMEPMLRLQWFNGLSEHGLTYLAVYHQVCLNAKVAAKSDAKSP